MSMVIDQPLLEVTNLSCVWKQQRQAIRLLDQVGFTVHSGQHLAVIGRTGAGKSTLLKCILGMHSARRSFEVTGSLVFNGRDINLLEERELQQIRGNEIALIPQNPMAALSPASDLLDQLTRFVMIKLGHEYRAALHHIHSVFETADLTTLIPMLGRKPAELSGGQLQRVLVCLAMACQPALLLADEPTSSLDQSSRADIIEFLKKSCDQYGATLMLVTHELDIISEVCDELICLDDGRVVEAGTTENMLRHPASAAAAELLTSYRRVADRS